LEEEENRLVLLRHAIREGMESGRAVDLDPKQKLNDQNPEKSSGRVFPDHQRRPHEALQNQTPSQRNQHIVSLY